MTLKISYYLIAVQILSVSGGFAQVAQTADEVRELLITSNLEEVAKSEGAEGDDYGVETIKKILSNREDDLFGGISDPSKFATLKELCLKIEELPERKQLEKELFEIFKKLNVIGGEPKNWSEVLIKNEGGSLGLVAKCLLAISGKEMQSQILNYLVDHDRTDKAILVLEKAKITGKEEELSRIIINNNKIEAAKSEELKALLLDFSKRNHSK